MIPFDRLETHVESQPIGTSSAKHGVLLVNEFLTSMLPKVNGLGCRSICHESFFVSLSGSWLAVKPALADVCSGGKGRPTASIM